MQLSRLRSHKAPDTSESSMINKAIILDVIMSFIDERHSICVVLLLVLPPFYADVSIMRRRRMRMRR